MSNLNLDASLSMSRHLSPRPPSVAAKISPRPSTSDSYASSMNSSMLSQSFHKHHRESQASDISSHPFNIMDGSPDSGVSSASASSRKGTANSKQRSSGKSRRASSKSRVAIKEIQPMSSHIQYTSPPPDIPIPDNSDQQEPVSPTPAVEQKLFKPTPPPQKDTGRCSRPKSKHVRARKLSQSAKSDRRCSLMLENPCLVDLSDELVLMVCDYLSLIERIRIEVVCRRLQRIARKSWKSQHHLSIGALFQDDSQCFDVRNCDAMIQGLLSRAGPFLSKLDMSHCETNSVVTDMHLEDPTYQALGLYCSNLVKLDLSYLPLTNTQLTIIADSNLLNVTHFRLMRCFEDEDHPDFGLSKMFKSMQLLEHVDLSMNESLTGECFAQFTDCLRTLILNKCTGLIETHVNILAKNTKKLEVLCANSTRVDLAFTLRALTRIRRLELNYYEFPLSEQIFMRLEDLVHLKLGHTYALTQDIMDTIGTTCTELQTLRIPGKETAIDRLRLKSCTKFKRLRELDVGWFEHLGDTDLAAVSVHGCLAEVSLHNCDKISPTAVLNVIRKNVNIRQLLVTGCSKMDDPFVKYASDLCRTQETRHYPLTLTIGFNMAEAVANTHAHHKFIVHVLRSWKWGC